MKATLYALLSILLCLASPFANGQASTCAQALQAVPYGCGGPNNCHGSGWTYVPYGGGNMPLLNYPINCCGTWIADYSEGGMCYWTELRTPEMQEKLQVLAQSSRLLVADCHGRYVRYTAESRRSTWSGLRDRLTVNSRSN
jgi:hypothetical protein